MIVEGGVVLVSGEVAARLGPSLVAWVQVWARTNGAALHPEVARVVAEVDALGRAFRARNVSERVGTLDGVGAVDTCTMSTAEAARVLGISERAVVGRCNRGSLPARRVAGRWRIDGAAVAQEVNFHPHPRADAGAALAVCGRCAVRVECLRHALAHGETAGVWGGYDEQARRRLHREAAEPDAA